LLVGPDRNGIDLEAGAVRRGIDTWVIHAMRLRSEFVEEYRTHLPWPE